MNFVRSSLLGLGLGATSMFLLDPARGARRRALIRDKMVRVQRRTVEAAGATWRDVGNRIVGFRSHAQTARSSRPVDDATLVERVKSALGRVTAHHRGISVSVLNQHVTVRGDALASEAGAIVRAVARVRGVAGVQNNLRTHASTEGIPMLQGGSPRPDQWTTWLAGSWSPAGMAAASAALVLAAAALVRGRSELLTAAGVAD